MINLVRDQLSQKAWTVEKKRVVLRELQLAFKKRRRSGGDNNSNGDNSVYGIDPK